MKNISQSIVFILITSLIFIIKANAQWTQVNGPLGGIVRCFAVSDSVIFAGTYHGGVYYSNNNGENWNPLSAELMDKSVWALGLDTTGLFIGTSSGIFHASKDNESWTVTEAGLQDSDIVAMAVAKENLFAATSLNAFRSSDKGKSWVPIDNGLPNTFLTCLAVIPDSSELLFAGTQGKGIFVSTNEGENWSNSSNGLSSNYIHYVLADYDSAESGNANIYACTDLGISISKNSGGSWAQTGLGNMALSIAVKHFKNGETNIYAGLDYVSSGCLQLSTDSGKTWTSMRDYFPPNNSVFAVCVSKDSMSDVLAGCGGAGVFKSTDNGSTWNASNTGLNGNDIYSLATIDNPDNKTTILAGTYNNFFISSDNGVNWTSKQFGYLFNRVQDLIVNNGNIIAKTFNGVYYSTNYGESWATITSLPNNNVRAFVIAPGFPPSIYIGYDGGGVFVSTDNGNSWVPAGIVGNNILYSLAVNPAASGSFTLYAGTANGVYASSDYGTNWIQNGLENTDVKTFAFNKKDLITATNNGAYISSDNGKTWVEAVSGLKSENIHSLIGRGLNTFASTDSGIFLWKDTSAKWIPVNEGLLNTSTVSMSISSTDLFVGTYGSGIWKRSLSELIGNPPVAPQLVSPITDSTINQTKITWRSVSNADSYELQVAYDSSFTNIILDTSLIDTTIQISKLIDGNRYYWRVSSENSAGESSYSDIWSFNFVLTGVDQTGSGIPKVFSLEQNYPNPFNSTTTINYSIPKASLVTIKIYDVLGNEVSTLLNTEKSAGYYKLKFNASKLASGIYFYRMRAGDFISIKKLILLK